MIKLTEATLDEVTDALVMSQPWGKERLFFREFFGSQLYITTGVCPSLYRHNIAQHAFLAFFESKGWTRVLEANVAMGEIQSPVYENIECDREKTFRGYLKAEVGFVKEGRKLMVRVNKDADDDIVYTLLSAESDGNLLTELFAYAEKNNVYRGKKITAGCRFLDIRNVSWADVVLPKKTQELLQTMVGDSIRKGDVLKANGLSIKCGILLTGRPGGGKTTCVKVVISEVPEGTTVIVAQPSHLTYASDIRNVCQMARDLSPSVLVIEDLDFIAEERDFGDAGRVIELMNQLDGIEESHGVITIGTTNELEKIEGAIKNRPGRFDRVITIDYPTAEERKRLIELFTQKYKVRDVNFDKLVQFTDGLSGAHLRDLCNAAASKAILEGSHDEGDLIAVVTQDHFSRAVAEVKNIDYSAYNKAKATKSGGMGFNAELNTDD